MGRSIAFALLLACGPVSHDPDGGDGGMDTPAIDAPAIDAPAIDAPTGGSDVPADASSCEGFEQGYTICPGDTRMCCGGTWSHFRDGPCWTTDAGGGDAGPPCSVDPRTPGCPCTVEGDSFCSPVTWRRTCTGGVWTERLNIGCCPGET